MRRSAEKKDFLLAGTWVEAYRAVRATHCSVFGPLIKVLLVQGLVDRKPQLLPNTPKSLVTLVERTLKEAETWLKENLNFSVPAQLDRICSNKKIFPMVAEGLGRIKNEEIRQVLAQILLAEEKNIRHGPQCACHPAIQQLKEFAECDVLCLS